jgi:uncharacterized protein (TIRG00374 family)
MPRPRTLLGFAISLLFLFLAVRNVEWREVYSGLKEVAPGFLFLTFFSFFASLLCRAFLWQALLSRKKKIPWSSSFQAILIGYMGNNVLPLRMGELMRAYAVGKKEALSKSLALASIVLERLLDLLSLLIFFGVLLLAMPLTKWLFTSGLVVFLFLISMAILLHFLAADTGRFVSRVMKPLEYLPAGLSEKARRIIHSFTEGLSLIKGAPQVVQAVFLSFLTWSLMTLSFYFCMNAFEMALPLTAPLLLVVVLNIGVMIPSSPGFIGIFQYLCILSLSFFDVPKENALAFSVVLHATQYLPVTLLGWLFWAREDLVPPERSPTPR